MKLFANCQKASQLPMKAIAVLALAAGAAADLAALAPIAPEEHAPAVERSAARAAKASRLLADHGHLLPPDLREKAHDLLNEHDFRVHAALDSAKPGFVLSSAAWTRNSCSFKRSWAFSRRSGGNR